MTTVTRWSVRSAQPEDVAAIADLAELKRAAHARRDPELWRPSPAARLFHHAWLRDRIACSPRRVRVACDGDRLGGFAVGSTRGVPRALWLEDWAVDHDAAGAGPTLLADLARPDACASVLALCARGDHVHAGVLEAAGFAPVETARTLRIDEAGVPGPHVRAAGCEDAAAIAELCRRVPARSGLPSTPALPPTEAELARLLQRDDALAVLVGRGSQVDACALARLLPAPELYAAPGPTLWVEGWYTALTPAGTREAPALFDGLERAALELGAAHLVVPCAADDDRNGWLEDRGYRASFDWYRRGPAPEGSTLAA